MEALRSTIWWDGESQQLNVNGRPAGVGIGSPRRGGHSRHDARDLQRRTGVKHDIQRALNVRNLHASNRADAGPGPANIDFAGSYEPSRGCATWIRRGSIR